MHWVYVDDDFRESSSETQAVSSCDRLYASRNFQFFFFSLFVQKNIFNCSISSISRRQRKRKMSRGSQPGLNVFNRLVTAGSTTTYVYIKFFLFIRKINICVCVLIYMSYLIHKLKINDLDYKYRKIFYFK